MPLAGVSSRIAQAEEIAQLGKRKGLLTNESPNAHAQLSHVYPSTTQQLTFWKSASPNISTLETAQSRVTLSLGLLQLPTSSRFQLMACHHTILPPYLRCPIINRTHISMCCPVVAIKYLNVLSTSHHGAATPTNTNVPAAISDLDCPPPLYPSTSLVTAVYPASTFIRRSVSLLPHVHVRALSFHIPFLFLHHVPQQPQKLLPSTPPPTHTVNPTVLINLNT